MRKRDLYGRILLAILWMLVALGTACSSSGSQLLGDGTDGHSHTDKISHPAALGVLEHTDVDGHMVGSAVPSEGPSSPPAPLSPDAMVPEPSALALLSLLLCGSALTFALRRSLARSA